MKRTPTQVREGRRAKRLRVAAGLTQAGLGKMIGKHMRTVARWESGRVAMPKVVEEFLYLIAKGHKAQRRRARRGPGES